MYIETKLYAQNKKNNSSCVKYISDDSTHVGVIQYFINVCNCLCQSPCNDCNDDCLTYAIIKRCILREAFFCSISELYVPTIFICQEIENDFEAINVKEILNICYNFKCDNVIYVVTPANLNKIM